MADNKYKLENPIPEEKTMRTNDYSELARYIVDYVDKQNPFIINDDIDNALAIPLIADALAAYARRKKDD